MINYKLHFKKIIYLLIFAAGVWFISFTIFPENQVIKINVGDTSPSTFYSPRYISVVDEERTQFLIDTALGNIPPVYSIDSEVNSNVIDGITNIFLTVIKSRTEERLKQSDENDINESEPLVEIISLTKLEQLEKLQNSILFSTISVSTIEVLIEISNNDIKNGNNYLTQLEIESKVQANKLLSSGISNENLNQIRQNLVSNPPNLNLQSEIYAIIPEARVGSAVAELIAENLIANQKLEEELWNLQKQKASESIQPIEVQFFKDEIIIEEGQVITKVIFQALDEIGYLSGQSRTVQSAAIPIIVSVFIVLYVLLWRLNDTIWKNDNELLLILTLLLISSLSLRGVSYFSQLSDFKFIQYGLPISFIGIISMTLLNLRATLILSLSSSLLALAGGGNIGLVALGALGTIIPAIFISEDTDRKQLRERSKHQKLAMVEIRKYK